MAMLPRSTYGDLDNPSNGMKITEGRHVGAGPTKRNFDDANVERKISEFHTDMHLSVDSIDSLVLGHVTHAPSILALVIWRPICVTWFMVPDSSTLHQKCRSRWSTVFTQFPSLLLRARRII
jgi:hypothetical protein